MPRLRRLLDWRAVLVYTHRWLGILGCVLFAAWFVSGIVMMYARMPSLAPEERLARADDLNLSAVTLSPSDAAKRAGVSVDDVQIAMLRGRPIYRFGAGPGRSSRRGGSGPTSLFADTGEPWRDTGVEEARAAARVFEPSYTGTIHDDGFLTEPDQWTLQARPSLPMHRFALDDAAATRLYVSAVTGEVVLQDDAQGAGLGLPRSGDSLDLFHAAPAQRSALERVRHLVVARRLSDVRHRDRVGRVALFAVRALPFEARRVAHALCRLDDVASLRRPDLRRRHVDVGIQRIAVDGAVQLVPAGGRRQSIARGAAATAGRGDTRTIARRRTRHSRPRSCRRRCGWCRSTASISGSPSALPLPPRPTAGAARA